MQPFLLKPAYKDYLWGGHRLVAEYGKQSDLPLVAESWELSAHADGPSVIASGEDSGLPFDAFVAAHPEACGRRFDAAGAFPILIKFIDAAQNLSIQVHPGDAYARRVEGEAGKTEMWVILDAAPGAFLYCGFAREISREEMRRRIEDGTITEVLGKLPVRRGDVVYIPAGTIHAIGAGLLLAEIQQNSNSTYRVYDFGRVGADGKPRELHIEKALDVTVRAPRDEKAPGAGEWFGDAGYKARRLAQTPYFTVDEVALCGRHRVELDGSSFVSVLCTEGGARFYADETALLLQKGDSLFVPATTAAFVLEGEGRFLLTGI